MSQSKKRSVIQELKRLSFECDRYRCKRNIAAWGLYQWGAAALCRIHAEEEKGNPALDGELKLFRYQN